MGERGRRDRFRVDAELATVVRREQTSIMPERNHRTSKSTYFASCPESSPDLFG
jgi:hypothetical protein